MAYFVETRRQPGVGSLNTSTPWRRRTASIAASDCGVVVGGLSPRPSQYRQALGLKPVSIENSACVSPVNARAARNWRPETMLDLKMSILPSSGGAAFTCSAQLLKNRITDRDSDSQGECIWHRFGSRLSAFGGKADMAFCGISLSRLLLGVKRHYLLQRTCLLLTQSGHCAV